MTLPVSFSIAPICKLDPPADLCPALSDNVDGPWYAVGPPTLVSSTGGLSVKYCAPNGVCTTVLLCAVGSCPTQ